MSFNGMRRIVAVGRPRWVSGAVLLTATLVTACGISSGSPGTVSAPSPTRETETPAADVTALAPSVTTPPAAQAGSDVALAYCFAFPPGFTQQAYGSQVEVVGPHAATDPHPGLMWIDATDARGRTAQDVAIEEMTAVGGPVPRSTVVLAGEEVPVLDGMPGQDLIRKVYTVHDGVLYTLNFAPDSNDIPTAKAQMEMLFSSVIDSWIWKPSGTPCAAAR